MSDPTSVNEPMLTIRRDAVDDPLHRRLRHVVPLVTLLAAALVVLLLVSGYAVLPFERVLTIEGLIASKAEYFNDPQVKRLLMRHNIRVHLTTRGSFEIARADLTGQDFVFPSGMPAAEVILGRLSKRDLYKPFKTPLVLATFRRHAEALRNVGAAGPSAGQDGAEPYFYDLDMETFLDLVETGRRWQDVAPIPSANRITVYTPSICRANSATTYMALVAFVRYGYDVPQTPEAATALAAKVKPLVSVFGQTSEDLLIHYKTPEGEGKPIVAIYESEFLAYQLAHRTRTGRLDSDRVLMYPSVKMDTEPVLIALTEAGEKLGKLLTDEGSPLQRRATELGFRVTSRGSAPTADELTGYMREKGLPMPDQNVRTTLEFPRQELLEKLVAVTGDCAS